MDKTKEKRWEKIIDLLLKEADYIPLKELAASTMVSTKTIQTDIKSINELFGIQVSIIKSKRGRGIKIDGSDNEKTELKVLMAKSLKETDYLSPIDRQLFILKKMILENQQLSYSYLSEKLLTSKSSIVTDIKEIEKSLSNKTISFVSNNNGTTISGKECDIRNGIVFYIIDYFISIGRKMEEISGQNRIFFFSNFFEEAKILQMQDSLFRVIKELDIAVSEYQFNRLLLHLLVQTERVENGYIVSKNDDFFSNKISFIELYPLAVRVTDSMFGSLGNNEKENEIQYLAKQVLSLSIKMNRPEKVYNKELIKVVKQVISRMSMILENDFTKDQNLLNALVSHIVPMIDRLSSHITIKNPLLDEIEKQYGVMVRATWLAISELESFIGYKLDRNEVGFFALYFQSALEKSKSNIRILIVCPTGIGTSELIANKVKKILPIHCHLEIATIEQIFQNKLGNIDLIISTVDLDLSNKKFIRVSPLLNKEDVKNISLVLSKIIVSADEENNEMIHIDSSLLDPELIYKNCTFKKKEDILHFLAANLYLKQYVTKEYEKNLFEREQMGATDLKTGVAIPHASPKEVKKTNVSILTLKEAIKWHNHEVDIIILLSIAEKDINIVKSLLSEVYKLVSNRKIVKNYILDKNTYEIIELIGDGSF